MFVQLNSFILCKTVPQIPTTADSEITENLNLICLREKRDKRF